MNTLFARRCYEHFIITIKKLTERTTGKKIKPYEMREKPRQHQQRLEKRRKYAKKLIDQLQQVQID